MKPIHLKFAAFLFACFFIFSCKKDNNSVKLPPRVNAGLAQVITMPVDSVTLTGTVTDAGSKVVGYLWSEVSGPNVPVIASEGSLSTVVRGLTAGNYIFQLMATDTFGVTGVDTVLVTVNPPAVVTLTSIPADDFMYVGNPSADFSGPGHAIELGAEAWSMNSVYVNVRSMFKFDFTGLPASAPVKSALLTLYSNTTPLTGNLSTPNAGSANAMYIQRVNQDWNPLTTTYNTQPTADVAGQVLIPATTSPVLDLVNIDVTAMVNTMIASGNYGFLIKLQTETAYNSRIFYSNYASDATKHPKLVLNY